MNRKLTVIDIVNLIGSIASITGISLLWLKDTTNVSPVFIFSVAIVVSFCFGLLVLDVFLIQYFYRRWFSGRDMLIKVLYFTLAAPVVSVLIILFTMVLGKVLRSPEFKWFFR